MEKYFISSDQYRCCFKQAEKGCCPFCLKGACPRSSHHCKLCFSSCGHSPSSSSLFLWRALLPPLGVCKEWSPAQPGLPPALQPWHYTVPSCTVWRQVVPSQISPQCSHFLVLV